MKIKVNFQKENNLNEVVEDWIIILLKKGLKAKIPQKVILGVKISGIWIG